MKIPARYIVAAALLVFVWKGSELTTVWPPAPATSIDTPKPPVEVLELAAPLKAILPKMLPKDRAYLASFYDAMCYVLLRDGKRERPIVSSTDQFAVLHAGSLQAAIDKQNVGRYPGLAEAIDETIVNIAGADARKVDAEVRGKLIAACSTLAWTLGINGDE